MSTLVYLLILLPLAILSFGISIMSLHWRNRSEDTKQWEKHHRNHTIAQAISIPLLVMVGYYGSKFVT